MMIENGMSHHRATYALIKDNGRIRRCLSCGTTDNMKRRRYCSLECRQKLRHNLNIRTGLLQALQIRYATSTSPSTSLSWTCCLTAPPTW